MIRNRQKGIALGFILVAISLLGIVGAVTYSHMNAYQVDIREDKDKALASGVLNQMNEIRTQWGLLVARGVRGDTIKTDPAQVGPGDTYLFDYVDPIYFPPEFVDEPSEPSFGIVGDESDAAFVLNGLNERACRAINKILHGLDNIPDMTAEDWTAGCMQQT
jgi:hypothetical protein